MVQIIYLNFDYVRRVTQKKTSKGQSNMIQAAAKAANKKRRVDRILENEGEEQSAWHSTGPDGHANSHEV